MSPLVILQRERRESHIFNIPTACQMLLHCTHRQTGVDIAAQFSLRAKLRLWRVE